MGQPFIRMAAPQLVKEGREEASMLSPYYCHNNGRLGTDPVVLIKMVLLQHLYGIPSLRQTQERVNDTVSYR